MHFIYIGLLVFMVSCGSLTSTTYLKGQETFVLGDNDHGSFNAQVKNVSKNELELCAVPNAGGKHSPKYALENQIQILIYNFG